jgi:hypothetical protein
MSVFSDNVTLKAKAKMSPWLFLLLGLLLFFGTELRVVRTAPGMVRSGFGWLARTWSSRVDGSWRWL